MLLAVHCVGQRLTERLHLLVLRMKNRSTRPETIPNDLWEFLVAGKQLDYSVELCEAGKVVLQAPGRLTVEPVFIDSEGSPLDSVDPNAGVKGYYAVPAISLLASCENFDPEGILIWLPDQSCYGTWDCDHWDVFTFGSVTWMEIVRDPVPFINAQWKHEIECEYLIPWDRYEFKKGRPW